jgi:hypothetical protein
VSQRYTGLYNHSREWASGIGIYGNVYLARTYALVQLCQDNQLIHQVDFFGEYQQVYIASFGGVVSARPKQVNHRLCIGLMDGVADDLVFFVGYTQVCSFPFRSVITRMNFS